MEKESWLPFADQTEVDEMAARKFDLAQQLEADRCDKEYHWNRQEDNRWETHTLKPAELERFKRYALFSLKRDLAHLETLTDEGKRDTA